MAQKQNPKLAVALLVGMPLCFGGYWLFTSLAEQKEAEQLARDGVTGVARVLSFENTGVAVNHNPRLRFRFDIQPDRGGAPLQVEKALIVTTMEAPRLQVGMTRKVRYLPNDPETLRFED